ncbi:CDP-alcohol phosphatidyltransferase family protein [Candidatus Enterococcus clewellii]|uniref:CDP-alcohol phosphatidyltransferase n=1 Tax=Candidatus Enterococcus clewellii TaxID=1834193 RepID=A0A242KC25_9ENTE|nr:CDP-alcohol phosphatidyltransferase family protein [Enterococcus sp. 9E7_DIV0242]OTP18724.1 hypothetical protein A5888_000538 [Enterococcus sp. 9E7_DIV0242]
MKQAANIVTGLRLLLTLLLLFTEPLSFIFFSLYLSCGISDMLDGYIARKTNTASSTGAILDSIADSLFLLVTAIKLLPVLHLPTWLLCWTLFVLAIRLLSYLVGFVKYRQFVSLHTYLNKLTGLLLFLSPLLYLFLSINILGIILVILAVASACEECWITFISKTVDRDRKSLFFH